MILVDTSVWVDYFRGKKDAQGLSQLLDENRVVIHPWVLGELMLGNLGPKRETILADLKLLPICKEYPMHELEIFIRKEKLYAKGVSLVDVQLLFNSIVEDHLLLTFDRRLHLLAKHYSRV